MSLRSSRFRINVPAVDLLTYIFASPYTSHGQWAAEEPLILAASGSLTSSLSFNTLEQQVRRFASGLLKWDGKITRVVIYGELTTRLPVVLLGSIAAGACCNICPPYPLEETAKRFSDVEADLVFFTPKHSAVVRAAAAQVGLAEKNLFILDHESVGFACGGLQHWTAFLDSNQDPEFRWRRLSAEDAKNTSVLLMHTSG
jgi:acyl-coenzyme A synthetase/AMP-(fatty) acid ligase